MKTQKSIRNAILAAFLCVPALSVAELTPVSEVEGVTARTATPASAGRDEGIRNPQQVTLGNEGVAIRGVIGNANGIRASGSVFDVDWYSFDAVAGTVLTLNIDAAWKGVGVAGNLNAYIALFEPAVEAQNAAGQTVQYFRKAIEHDDLFTWQFPIQDDPSISLFDPRLDEFKLTKTGIWTIGVAAWSARPFEDGTGKPARTSIMADPNGSYILNIVVKSLPVTEIPIAIEIKPGSGDSAPVNHKAGGVIPVAILSSDKFNALTVEPDSLTFGLAGDETSWLRCGKGGADVNADGLPDLICHFDNQTALKKWEENAATTATLKGKTKDGTKFKGVGSLKRKD